MAVLTAKQRNEGVGGASKFALPGGRYPDGDKAHAIAAKARATQELAKGNLSPEDAAKVRHSADVTLGETDSTYHNQ
jgi:hypothetical protein